MKRIYKHFLGIITFFLIVFAIARFVFILFNKNTDPSFTWGLAFPSFIRGMRMDLSVIAYTLLPALIFTAVFLIRPFKWVQRVEYYYHLFILLLLDIILISNILLYHYWNSLLNFHALTYLQDFSEIGSSFTVTQLIFVNLALVLFIGATFYFFKRYFLRYLYPIESSPVRKSLHWILMVGITIILMRGGLQMLPMNESLISVSENNFVNQATVNPTWHLANDIYRAGIFEGNPFEVSDEQIAEERVKKIFECVPDSFPRMLTTSRPNIVVLILESFTADVVGAMNGEKGISPSLDRLIGEGIFFNNIYASGTRTDQGIVSILNGWPATPYYSIMRSTEKSNRLPSLPKIFLKEGYSTSFFYGGESNFSNLNVYCNNQKFQSIIGLENFPPSTPRGRWGVNDGEVLSFQSDALSKTREPFFSVLMTLSNHEPFDVPGPKRFPGDKDPEKFRNAAAYTDAMLGEYFSRVNSLPWYRNTLFIIVADHGHELPLHTNVYYPESHKIPMLFYGEVIKPEFKGAAVTKLGGHHDIPSTLLSQLEMKEVSEFSWSKNLLNPTVKPFAYYQIGHVLGWIDSKYWYGYSYNREKYLSRSFSVPKAHLDSMKVEGQSFLQELYKQYRRY